MPDPRPIAERVLAEIEWMLLMRLDELSIEHVWTLMWFQGRLQKRKNER